VSHDKQNLKNVNKRIIAANCITTSSGLFCYMVESDIEITGKRRKRRKRESIPPSRIIPTTPKLK